MKFSIVIPFYNLERYVAECLESVLAQAFEDYEAICVDDGSTDETARLLDEFARRDSRIRVIHKLNGGEGSARNAGLETAQGEWICYLDGDDIWAPTFLADMAAVIVADSTIDMVSSRQWNFNDGEKGVPPPHAEGLACYDTAESLSADLFMIGVWNTAYRRADYGDLRFTEQCVGADRVYTMKCLSRSQRVVVLAAQNYGYRLRGNSMAHGAWSVKKQADAMDSARLCVETLAHSGKRLPSNVRRMMASAWLEQSPMKIWNHPMRSERRELLSVWQDGIAHADERVRAFLPTWYKVSTSFLKFVRPVEVPLFLFSLLPLWLKTRGLHR